MKFNFTYCNILLASRKNCLGSRLRQFFKNIVPSAYKSLHFEKFPLSLKPRATEIPQQVDPCFK